jgi:hypothetical protein
METSWFAFRLGSPRTVGGVGVDQMEKADRMFERKTRPRTTHSDPTLSGRVSFQRRGGESCLA